MEHLDDTAFLRQQGYRLTPQRIQLLQALKAHGQHITAEELHGAILPLQPYLDIATVYRGLQWLQSVGLAASISMGDGLTHYEYHRPGEHHHHLHCQQCGQAIQIADELFATLRADIEGQYGFVLKIDHLALTGLCAACVAAERAN